MTRESFAALLLAALVAVSVWSIRRIDRLCDELDAHLEKSEKAALAEDYENAALEADAALRIWLGAKTYTHIFIRHPEIDSTADAFFSLQQALGAQNARELPPVYALLRYHLNCIRELEHISVGSVF